MEDSLKKLYQDVVNLGDKEKIALGYEAEQTVIKYLIDNFKAEDAAVVYAMLIGTYVGVDGKISAEEYAFCKAVFEIDLPAEEFCNMIESTCTVENIELMDRVMDDAPADVKSAFVTLGLALCSIDNTITAAEQALLTKYLA